MKAFRNFIYALGFGIAILVIYVFLFATWPGDTTNISIIEAGGLEPFIIGGQKVEVLSKQIETSFSPQPKSKKCPKNWINTKTMDSRERLCLLSSDQWEASIRQKLCADNEDSYVTMYFSNEKLSSIIVRCSLGI